MEFITENQEQYFAIKEMNDTFIKNVKLFVGNDDQFETLEEVQNMYNSGTEFAEMSGIEYNNAAVIKLKVK